MRSRFFRTLLLMLGLAVTGCKHPAKTYLPTIQMHIGSGTFTIEVAHTFAEQEHGLMERDSLDPDHGMIFPSNEEKVRTYWNHHVHFPLDLLFLDATGKVVSVKQMESFSDTNVSSDEKAKYVIELLGGTAAKIGVVKGVKVELPKEVSTGEWPE